jgi:hypothetical protein
LLAKCGPGCLVPILINNPQNDCKNTNVKNDNITAARIMLPKKKVKPPAWRNSKANKLHEQDLRSVSICLDHDKDPEDVYLSTVVRYK